MENHPRTGNCQGLAKIMTGSEQDHGKKYPCQNLNRFLHGFARTWIILGNMLNLGLITLNYLTILLGVGLQKALL